MSRIPLRRVTLRRAMAVMADIEFASHSIMARWHDGVPPEVRAEVSLEIYEPALDLRLEYERRTPSGKRSPTQS